MRLGKISPLTAAAITGISITLMLMFQYNFFCKQKNNNAEEELHHLNSRVLLHSATAIPDNLSSILSKSMQYNAASNEKFIESQLLENAVPPIVHYMWCGKYWFEFKHYLSVLSIMKSVNPDKIIFHYNFEPIIDKKFYNMWMEDLKHDYPYLVLEKMAGNIENFCQMDLENKIASILRVLRPEGGIYVGLNTLLLDVPQQYRLLDFKIALERDSIEGYIFVKSNIIIKDLHQTVKHRDNDTSCHIVEDIKMLKMSHKCFILKGKRFKTFWPKDIWDSSDQFSRLCRKLFYGKEIVPSPKPSYDSLVPNVGHLVWIGGRNMDFLFYLSVLSMLYVAEVDIVYIHGDKPLRGRYWNKLNSIERIRERIKCIKRTPPSMVYQSVIQPQYASQMSNVIRVEAMIKYGGIYTDTDAIWVKPLTLKERGFEAVACYDWINWSYPYPDIVNFGVSYGKRNAPFWKLYREGMRYLRTENHGYTGTKSPYKVLEKHPDLLKIDKHLSVICHNFKCHPIWVKDYHNIDNNHVTTNSINNWREDVHAFHWTNPTPLEYANESMLLNATGLFADIGKFVLRKAGLI